VPLNHRRTQFEPLKIKISQQTINTLIFFLYIKPIIILYFSLIIMTNPTSHQPSILAQCIADEEQAPSFSFPKRITDSDSPVFKVSFEMTPDDEENLETLDAILAKSKKQHKRTFPPMQKHYCRAPSISHGLFTADPWPIGFNEHEWKIVQFTEVVKIDPLLRRFDYAHPLQQLAELEEQFKGATYRLTLNPNKSVTVTPCFIHGMTISYLNCNLRSQRYIIDHCAYHDETTAYLRVLCFTGRRKTCGIQSEFPPFILAIPKELCQVRIHPDFENIILSNPISTTEIEHTEFSPPVPSYFSVDQEEVVEEGELIGWKDWFLQKICLRY
jgi:hypothetical protein